MLGLSYAAVPLYDLFCRVTGFGGTTQISNNAPKIVLNKVVSVRFDTNVNNLPWDFKAKTNVIDVKVGQVNKIEFEVTNYSNVRINLSNVTPTTTKIDTRGRGRQGNIVISSNDVGDNWRFGTLRLDVKPDGGR